MDARPTLHAPVHPAAAAARTLPKRPKKKLTDRYLKALKPAAKGEGTYDQMDGVIPAFGVRVAETGRKTFILAARFPSSPAYTRRALGVYGAMSLERARKKAKAWLELIDAGVDPQAEEERLKIEAQRKAANSFRLMAESYIAQAVIGSDPEQPKQRKAREVQRNIEKEFIAAWGGRPVADITSDDVESVIAAVVARGSPGQARNVLGIAKSMFGWAARQKRFGFKASPCGDLKAQHIIGPKKPVDRILNDTEIAALWRNVDRLKPTDPRNRGIAVGPVGYPYGPLYKMLLLTGLRLNECADASWSEFDLKEKLWTIPKERMKGTNEKARAHVVPLTDHMLATIEKLPRFKSGEFLFSITAGKTPIWISDKVKKRLDRRMLRSLRALARKRGENPGNVAFAAWTNHDLRRTLRSGLSRLRIDHDVKEAILAHVKTGIVGTYDRYDLLDEKREALTLWAARLRDITSPPPDNVVKLPARA